MTWSIEPLEHLIDTLESGSRPTGGASTESGAVLSIGGENILQSGGVTLKGVKRVPVAFFKRMTKGQLRADDVLINKDGAQTGKVGWYHPDRDLVACINEHVFLLRGKPDRITQGYLYYSLLSDSGQAQIRLEISGSAQPGLKTGFTQGVIVEFPADIREQSMIARVLSTVDRAITRSEAFIAKEQRIKTGLMQDLLTCGVDEDGNLRSEQTHEFKDSPLGRIPAEWYVTTIGDQFVERKERGRTGLPVMSIVMNVGLVKRSSVDRRVETALTPEQHALVCEGDIAYNMMRMWQGVLGRASSDCLVSPAYVVLRPLESIDSRFAQWRFRDLRTIHAFCKASKGIVDDRLRLYPKDIFPIPIAMPTSLDEHSLIADRLDAQHRAIEASVLGLEKLHLLKRGLMQDLLTGNRRVTALLEPSGVTA